MSERTRYRLAGLGIVIIVVGFIAATAGVLDLREQADVDAITIDAPSYVVASPVTEATTPPSTASTPVPASTSNRPPAGVDGPVASVTSQPTITRGTAVQLTPTLPPPPMPWLAAIPEYGNRGACTADEATVITSRFAARGASPDSQSWALWIASRETGCDTSQHNVNQRTRDDSYGWCQLNARAGHFGPNGVLAGWDRNRLLTDLAYASDACAQMWAVCGRGPWQPPYSCSPPEELS